MKEFKGTKGEWKVKADGMQYWVGTESKPVAKIANILDREKRDADAQLIAAAPKLLEATKTMHEWISWKCKDEADLDLNLGNIEGLINEALGL